MDDPVDSGASGPGPVGVVDPDGLGDDDLAKQVSALATQALLADALKPLDDDGPICVLTDGTVRLSWRGPRPEKAEHTIDLDPPTVGEYQALIGVQEKIEKDAAKRNGTTRRATSDCYKWWQAAVKALSDTTLPPEAECPAWLLHWNLVTRTVYTWLSVPTKAPGD